MQRIYLSAKEFSKLTGEEKPTLSRAITKGAGGYLAVARHLLYGAGRGVEEQTTYVGLYEWFWRGRLTYWSKII